MNHHLTLTILGNNAKNIPEKISKAVRDLGGDITECRLSKMDDVLSGMLTVQGGWDAIAKIEAQIPRLESELKLRIHSMRTETQKAAAALPYGIDIVSSCRPGLVHEISRFMAEHDVEIHDLYATTHQPAQTATPMITLHMSVNVPAALSIAALRGEFMDFCDSLNLDAIMEPSK